MLQDSLVVLGVFNLALKLQKILFFSINNSKKSSLSKMNSSEVKLDKFGVTSVI
jgi:hypothetical protein